MTWPGGCWSRPAGTRREWQVQIFSALCRWTAACHSSGWLVRSLQAQQAHRLAMWNGASTADCKVKRHSHLNVQAPASHVTHPERGCSMQGYAWLGSTAPQQLKAGTQATAAWQCAVVLKTGLALHAALDRQQPPSRSPSTKMDGRLHLSRGLLLLSRCREVCMHGRDAGSATHAALSAWHSSGGTCSLAVACCSSRGREGRWRVLCSTTNTSPPSVICSWSQMPRTHLPCRHRPTPCVSQVNGRLGASCISMITNAAHSAPLKALASPESIGQCRVCRQSLYALHLTGPRLYITAWHEVHHTAQYRSHDTASSHAAQQQHCSQLQTLSGQKYRWTMFPCHRCPLPTTPTASSGADESTLRCR